MARAVWGIDLGTSSIKGVRMEGGGGQARITRFASLALPLPSGPEGVEDEARVREGLRLFATKVVMPGESICCCLSNHATFNRSLLVPQVEPARLPDIVRYEGKKVLEELDKGAARARNLVVDGKPLSLPIAMPSLNLADMVWDYHLIDREYEVGEELDVVLFTIKREIVNTFIKELRTLGIRIDILQFAPVALYNFIMWDQEVPRPTLVMDLGARNTDLLLLQDARYTIRTRFAAGKDLTQAIQTKFQCGWSDAEKLKVGATQSAQGAQVFNVIQPLMMNLVEEVHRWLAYQAVTTRTPRVDRIVLAGNGAKTINLRKFLAQMLQMEVVTVSRLNRISVAEGVSAPELQRHLPALGVAIGLALQGLGEAPNRVNLLAPRDAPPAEPAAPAAPEQLRLPCGQCGKEFAAPPSIRGKRVKCPRCGASVSVPP